MTKLAEKVNKVSEECVSTSTNSIFYCENEITVAPDSVATFTVAKPDSKLKLFYSTDKIRKAPVGCKFLGMDLCVLITNWFCGDLLTKISPYFEWTEEI